ncbi:hypothetical protein SAY87_010032 [Trapa incisa]|uniref:Transcription factor VOZ1 n=1 Tax=Trapa incisa TaxID=236973 RepID=A0AAN7GDL3_9MYRT|nr:hypothetical protein SAY87_010032 [Trapa incisa]
MGRDSKSYCKSASHKQFKDRAKNRVDDLQGMLTDLQFARKENRSTYVNVLEEQVHQMLREWKSELNEPSPASSLQQGGSLASFSSDIYRLLQLCEEEDDATSALAVPKPDTKGQTSNVEDKPILQEAFSTSHMPLEPGFPLVDHGKDSLSGTCVATISNVEGVCPLEQLQYEPNQVLDLNYIATSNNAGYCGKYMMPNPSSYLPSVFTHPSAFLGPKCALWDCPRPIQGLEWCQDYCSSFHAALAMNEGPPGMGPILRPGGIGLKDGILFAALGAKSQGKYVGIPVCEGAATAKSPWNAPDLFDLSVLEGETIREWLFFDKPRRAFESGNRKQRSLPDYSGRGWHESRKQVMNEFGGLKRSYYMDPQPLIHFEWHLYEYEINKYDDCALYKLELKLVDWKKNSKGKFSSDSVADLQKQMGRLSAAFPSNNKWSVKGMTKLNPSKDCIEYAYANQSKGASANKAVDYGLVSPHSYPVNDQCEYPT